MQQRVGELPFKITKLFEKISDLSGKKHLFNYSNQVQYVSIFGQKKEDFIYTRNQL